LGFKPGFELAVIETERKTIVAIAGKGLLIGQVKRFGAEINPADNRYKTDRDFGIEI
jgi:hypothetical protein